MLIFPFLLFSLLPLLSTSQPYKPTDYFLLNCGGGTATSNRKWDTDERSKFMSSTTTSFISTPNYLDPSVPEIPYSTARMFNSSSFTYTFPVTNGPKFLRLYFYPATYSHHNANQSFFSVSSNGYSLLSNFSAFLTSSYEGSALNAGARVPHLIKEFIIYVNDTQTLYITFTPSSNSYAFINGIEIASMPETLYFKAKNLKYVGQITGPVIGKDTAVENIYRLNVGGGQISVNNDTGMYRAWDGDENYIFPSSAIGLTPTNYTPITYSVDTPNYTAPELVYATQRSMGKLSMSYNLTWLLPVDSGFYYMIRLHFCSIITQYTFRGQMIFKIFINNQTAEDEADLFFWTPGSGYALFKDYVVFVQNSDRSKQDLWLALHPNEESQEYRDGFLNGLEVFKMSMVGSLASPNPELSTTPPPPPRPESPGEENTKRTLPYVAIIGGGGGGILLFSVLGFIVFWQKKVKRSDNKSSKSSGEPKSKKSGISSCRCRRFSLKEVKDATNEFTKDFVIGKGGFGMVYKGYIDNTTVVAIKRLKSSSKQGFHEFQTEIGMLSKLCHVNIVSLIGYCDEEGEMLLVYDYMANGILRDHLYNTNNPHLSWKRRLDISAAAAKGLHYLHTGANRAIIHRDVKSTNILLDENLVAKVSDFGLSKLGPKDQTQNHVTTLVKGTFGYMDPEYYRMQQLTEKSDVYSFGVVLLEVLCARPVINTVLPYEEVNLVEWAKSHYGKRTLHEIVDPRLLDETTIAYSIGFRM